MPNCIICLGSNDFEKREKLCFARKRLSELFPSVCFADECDTEPIYLTNPNWFLNQLASFYTDKEIPEVIVELKDIESKAGRTTADKALEIIKLDIDLLIYGDLVLKPEDMTRQYVIDGVRQLHNNK